MNHYRVFYFRLQGPELHAVTEHHHQAPEPQETTGDDDWLEKQIEVTAVGLMMRVDYSMLKPT